MFEAPSIGNFGLQICVNFIGLVALYTGAILFFVTATSDGISTGRAGCFKWLAFDRWPLAPVLEGLGRTTGIFGGLSPKPLASATWPIYV
jgi:hypothetical protein